MFERRRRVRVGGDEECDKARFVASQLHCCCSVLDSIDGKKCLLNCAEFDAIAA